MSFVADAKDIGGLIAWAAVVALLQPVLRWLYHRLAPMGRSLGEWLQGHRDASRWRAAREEASAYANRLRDSEKRFIAFMHHLPGVAFIKDEPGRYVYFNEALAKLVPPGVTLRTGMVDTSVWPEGVADRFRANDREVLDGGRPKQVIETVPQPEGLRHFIVSKFPITGDNGQRLLGGIAVDITEMKEANETARRAEEQYATFFENAIEGIFRTSPDGHYLAANPKLATIYGYGSPEELKNSVGDISRQLYVIDSRRGEFRELMERDGTVTNFESEIYRKDGRKIWITENSWAIRDEAGKLLYYEGTVVDITAQKHAESLNVAKHAAEEANKAKSEFLANMSHEIRTPMTAILGYTDMLLEELREQPKAQDWLGIVRRNGNHLLGLINDILDLSKIEAGKMTVERIACSPCQIVADVASLMRARAGEKRLAFDIEYLGAIPETIRTDPTRLRQILLNLVSNAIKFTQMGGVHIVVKLSSQTLETSTMQFDVVDSGIGLTDEQMERMFEAFSQADTSHARRFGGTGLGLAISRRLARMLGGEIHISSLPGQGSTFSVTIDAGSLQDVPLLERPREAITWVAPAPTVAASIAEGSFLSGRILLAEDGLDNQQMISLILRKAGATVTVAENGVVAMNKALAAAAAGQAYELILMDMQMPEMDGYTATSELRRKGYSGAIVALTAHAMSGDREKCITAGCDDFATKPINRQALLGVARTYMDRCGEREIKGKPTAPTTAPQTSQPLYSDLCGDPEMLEAIEGYVKVLPQRVNAITQAMSDLDFATLLMLAHQLKGSAGTFGFMPITTAAGEVERRVKVGSPITELQRSLDELISLMQRVKMGPELQKSVGTAQNAAFMYQSQ